MNNLWLTRDNSGYGDWLSTRLHDGISIDGSFLTPGTDTRTWWERAPFQDIQSWGNASQTHMVLKQGNVGIGTTTPDFKLTVNGKIKAEEIQVVVDVPADYVFEEDYSLMPLEEVEKFVTKNKHLPGMPDAQSLIANGWQVGEMNNKLLEKVEELTLYLIEMNKELDQVKKENKELKRMIQKD